VVFEACVITPTLVLARKITPALVLSTKKSGKRRNSKINAVSDCLGEVRVGAKLLAEADEDEGLNQPVEVSFHGVIPSACRIARPISSATCGTTAFPRHRSCPPDWEPHKPLDPIRAQWATPIVRL